MTSNAPRPDGCAIAAMITLLLLILIGAMSSCASRRVVDMERHDVDIVQQVAQQDISSMSELIRHIVKYDTAHLMVTVYDTTRRDVSVPVMTIESFSSSRASDDISVRDTIYVMRIDTLTILSTSDVSLKDENVTDIGYRWLKYVSVSLLILTMIMIVFAIRMYRKGFIT